MIGFMFWSPSTSESLEYYRHGVVIARCVGIGWNLPRLAKTLLSTGKEQIRMILFTVVTDKRIKNALEGTLELVLFDLVDNRWLFADFDAEGFLSCCLALWMLMESKYSKLANTDCHYGWER